MRHLNVIFALSILFAWALAGCGEEGTDPGKQGSPNGTPDPDPNNPGPDDDDEDDPAPGVKVAAESTFQVSENQVKDGYRFKHYVFRHPAAHGKSKELTVTQRVEVIVPNGVEKNAPVYFIIDNERDSTRDTLMADTALLRFFGSKMIYVAAEHRGYGQSLSDDEDQSVPTYVSHAQAVEDAHSVIEALQKEYTGTWMVAGYSYGGALAIALGAKYPDDAKAFAAISAPVEWLPAHENYEGYVRLTLGGAYFQKAATMMEAFQPANSFSRKWQNREFLEMSFMGMTQFAWGEPYVEVFKGLVEKSPEEVIDTARKLDETALASLTTNGADTRSYVKVSREDLLKRDHWGRVWYYQQCAELGVFMATPTAAGIFKRTLEEHAAECAAMFDERNVADLTAGNVLWSLQADVASFGGEGPKLVYVRGGRDPWQDLGLRAPNWAPRAGTDKYSVYDTAFGSYVNVPAGKHLPVMDDAEVGLGYFGELFRHANVFQEPQPNP